MVGILAMGAGDAAVRAGGWQEPVTVPLETVDPTVSRLLSGLVAKARIQPNAGEPRGRLGMAYQANGFTTAALDSYAQAAALQPDEVRWPYLRALMHGRLGDYDAALAGLERAIALDGNYLPAWLWKGTWLLESGRHEAAVAAFGRADELGSEPAATVGLARARLAQGRPELAEFILAPLARSTTHPYVHRILGVILRALGKEEDARIAFARGRLDRLLVWPDPRAAETVEYIVSAGGRLALAERMVSSGAAQQALPALEELRDDGGDDPQTIRVLAEAYAKTGRSGRARALLRLALEKHPRDYFLHLYLAGLYNETGDFDDALEHMRRAIDLVPTRGKGHAQLAILLIQQRRYDEALESLDTALKHGVQSPQDLLYSAGMIEFTRGNWGAAARRFRRATDIDEAFTEAYVMLGVCLIESEKLVEAEEALDWAGRLGNLADDVAAARQQLAEARRARE